MAQGKSHSWLLSKRSLFGALLLVFSLLCLASVLVLRGAASLSSGFAQAEREAGESAVKLELSAAEDNAVLPMLDKKLLKKIKTVYVLPGGGSTEPSGKRGYPEWTRRRVVAAHEHYLQENKPRSSIFFALSAGSLNAPNLLQEDGRTVFECQHMINHLISLGVPSEKIFGDTMSWDTVGNGLTLRLLLEGLLIFTEDTSSTNNLDQERREEATALLHRSRKRFGTINVEVFISDFHANRVKEVFSWVLALEPSLSDQINFHINSVDSVGIEWPTAESFNGRVAHEERGVEMVRALAKSIRTAHQLQAYMLLGGHKGLRDYLHGNYQISKGGGW